MERVIDPLQHYGLWLLCRCFGMPRTAAVKAERAVVPEPFQAPPIPLPEPFFRRRANRPGDSFVVRTAEDRATAAVARASARQLPGNGPEDGRGSAVPRPDLHPRAPRAARPGRSCFRTKEVVMFEGQPQNEIDALIKANP